MLQGALSLKTFHAKLVFVRLITLDTIEILASEYFSRPSEQNSWTVTGAVGFKSECAAYRSSRLLDRFPTRL